MEERSKTNREIFKEKYPVKEVSDNALLCAEAIGYLKALIQYFPSEEKWIAPIKADLTLMLIHFMK